MLSITEIKNGKKILWNNEPYEVVDYQHSKIGRAGAVLRTKLKNLTTGALLDHTFQGADKLEEAAVSKAKAQFLYKTGDSYEFMDTESYEQLELQKVFVGDRAAFLQDGMMVTVQLYNDRPIGVSLPDQVTLTITEADPVVKGQTAASSYKPAVLENGIRVLVPPFIGSGERIIVDTNELTYVRRAD